MKEDILQEQQKVAHYTAHKEAKETQKKEGQQAINTTNGTPGPQSTKATLLHLETQRTRTTFPHLSYWKTLVIHVQTMIQLGK